jgi:hypothetical protein
MKRNLIILAAILLMVPLALYAQGRGERGSGMGMGHGQGMGMCGGPMMDDDDFVHPGMLLRCADELGLNEDQQNQILKMNEEHAMARIDREAELEKAQVKLHHLMINDGSEKDILSAMDKIGTLRTEMKKMNFQHFRQVKGILNADQIKKFKELAPKMRGCDEPKGRGIGQCGTGSGMGMGQGDGPGMGAGGQGSPRCDMPCQRR